MEWPALPTFLDRLFKACQGDCVGVSPREPINLPGNFVSRRGRGEPRCNRLVEPGGGQKGKSILLIQRNSSSHKMHLLLFQNVFSLCLFFSPLFEPIHWFTF